MELEIAEETKTLLLPTLSLQILAENCFKHNAMSSKTPLIIKIYTTDNNHITIKNNINPKLETGESSGYGLENLKNRYEILGIKNGVVSEKINDVFCVKLKLIETA